MGFEQFGDNKRAVDQGKDARKEGYHFENLFDLNEDQAGETTNLATGKPIENDRDDDLNMLVTRKRRTHSSKGVISDDAATALLKQYNFNENGDEIKEETVPKKKKAA